MQRFSAFAHLYEGNMDITRPLVLVVDDNPAILDMLSSALMLQGYQPICIDNGQEALKWIEQVQGKGQYPAAILLDLLMPGMDGSTFLSHLSACWKAPRPIPPVLLLTAQLGDYDHLPCRDVLIKPFHIKDLGERLSRWLGRVSSNASYTANLTHQPPLSMPPP